MKKLFLILIALIFIVPTHKASAAQPHPPGTLISINSTIWRISDQGTARQAIDSVEKFYSQRFNFINVVPANNADLTLPDNGLLPWGDGVVFSYNNVIYQVSGGQKHGFVSAEVYLGQGFTFAMAKLGNLSSLPDGSSIRQATERHLPGTWLISQGTIWQQDSTQARAFPSAATFFSYGGLFSDAVPMNQSDQNNAGAQAMPYRAGALINDQGTLWAVTATTKLGFPDANCFLGFGFSFGASLSGDTSQLNNVGSICAETVAATNGATSSYTEASVQTTNGTFLTRAAAFNLASGKIKVITDTAADRDCANNCPVASLSTYLNTNGAASGINGTYFCPQDYPECSSQSNSFFWKIIDTNLGKMINANNGLGEQDPFLAFDAGGKATYFRTWMDFKQSNFSAIAGVNSYSMIENGNISLNYAKLDNKQTTVRSIRGAIGIKGQTLYLVQVLNATVPDTATVLKSLGLDHALGLDGGGSSALTYQNSIKTNPGRNIPNAILVQVLP